MHKILFIVIFFFTFSTQGQGTISGTFSPAKEYSWGIAYKLKPGTQVYVADTAIKKGKFNLTIPENSTPGMYRIVYAIPQEEFYFDVLYNGKEDIEFTFNIDDGPKFTASEENVIYQSYTEAINTIEQEVVNFYLSGETDKKKFSKLAQQSKDTQALYVEKSKGLLVHEFIKANTLPIPPKHTTIEDYIAFKKEHYFNNVDMKNPVLLASTFLTDKIGNYVFTALPTEIMSQDKTEKEINNNVKLVNTIIQENTDSYRLHVMYSLWSQAAASNFNIVSDYIYNSYLKELATTAKNEEIINQIETHNRLRLGAIPPEVTWKENQKKQTLSTLTGADNYVLVFWSSTCSHCLKELPALHKKLKNNTQVTVIAVGLESDDITWKKESSKLSSFKHAIALGKWDSEYAKLYNIQATPTYYLLDKEKHIIAKPENDKELIELLNKE